jgi:hypothetical protein
MSRRGAALLTCNAAIVVLLTCVAGLPYGEARKKEAGQHTWFHVSGTASQWRLAHAEGLMNSILVIALAAALGRVALTRRSETLIFWSLVAMVWGNFLGAVTAALGADDSFSTALARHNPVAMLLYSAAAVGAFVGLIEAARCAWREAQRPEVRSEEPASVG